MEKCILSLSLSLSLSLPYHTHFFSFHITKSISSFLPYSIIFLSFPPFSILADKPLMTRSLSPLTWSLVVHCFWLTDQLGRRHLLHCGLAPSPSNEHDEPRQAAVRRSSLPFSLRLFSMLSIFSLLFDSLIV